MLNMKQPRKKVPTGRHQHYCLFVNREAANYNSEDVSALVSAIRNKGARYTIVEQNSAARMAKEAEQAVGERHKGRYVAQSISRRGPITALIACGGDGTFNLVARAAMKADLPIGILPSGLFNNIAKSLHGELDVNSAISRILGGKEKKIDSGLAGNQPFFGSLGLGFIPVLSGMLNSGKVPRFGFSWSQLGGKAAAEVPAKELILKVDAFRFEVSPMMFNINLLAYSSGIKISPASVVDDQQAEVIFDRGDCAGEFGSFTRLMRKGKYLYGSEIRLYRGRMITCQPTQGRMIYLDGELIELPTNLLEIEIGKQQVKVFC